MHRPHVRHWSDLRRAVPAAALSLSLAAAMLTPTPAAADREDVARAIAALAALGIIAYAVDRANDDEPAVSRAAPIRPRPMIQRPRTAGPERTRAGFLPVACVVANGTRPAEFGTRRDRRVVGRGCLRRSNVQLGVLPQSCEGDVFIGGRDRRVYGLACLHDAGFRFR